MSELLMPRLSDSMEVGTIVAWLVATGDNVERDQVVVEIETDKATMEFAADTDGVIELLVEVGDTLPLGSPIAAIHPLGWKPTDKPVSPPTPSQTAAPTAKPETQTKAEEPQTNVDQQPRIPSVVSSLAGTASFASTKIVGLVSPIAQRTAERLKVDLGGVPGSGPGGRITKDDVLSRAKVVYGTNDLDLVEARIDDSSVPTQGLPSNENQSVIKASRIEQLVAARMSQSRTDIPSFDVTMAVKLDELIRHRSQLKKSTDSSKVPSVTDYIVKACASALTQHSLVNSFWQANTIVNPGQINIGVAVSTEQGRLVVPVLRNVDQHDLQGLSELSSETIDRARRGRATPNDLEGGTFTVSNLGMFGVTSFDAVITPGQGAILAVGGPQKHLQLDAEGNVEQVTQMQLTLCSDHRHIYGAYAAEFLQTLKGLLEAPDTL